MLGAGSLAALKAVGQEMPVVPPALVLMLVAAVLVAVVRRPWTSVVAILVAGVATLATSRRKRA